jgi:chromodomain-helicase-DNA-binding protein 4
MSAGKKKLMLDHVIVQNMDEDEAPEDLEGMLLSGAKALFEDNDENDVVCAYFGLNLYTF